jgi:peptide deformylase
MPDIKPIVRDDDPQLRTVSALVTEFDESLMTLIEQMLAAMITNQGIGLSAIQIGVAKRVIVAFADKEMHVMINPEYIRKLNREVVMEEGCLSIPGLRRKVSRPAKCEIAWQDPEGNFHTGNFSGMLARIIQHEMDHLQGVLITDKPHVQ